MQLQLQKLFCNLSLASVVSKESLVFCCILLDSTQGHLPARALLHWLISSWKKYLGFPRVVSIPVCPSLVLGRFSPLNTCPAAILEQSKSTWDVLCAYAQAASYWLGILPHALVITSSVECLKPGEMGCRQDSLLKCTSIDGSSACWHFSLSLQVATLLSVSNSPAMCSHGLSWCMYHIASLLGLCLSDEGFSHIANSIWKAAFKVQLLC